MMRLLSALTLSVVALWLAACGKHPVAADTCHLNGPAVTTKVNVISYPSPGMEFFGDRMASCTGQGALQVRHSVLPYQELVNQATIAISSAAPSNYHIIHVYDALLVEWAAKGWLAPLDDLVAKYWDQYKLAQIPDAIWQLMKYNGHIYAVPAIQNVQIFYYRKDLFAHYGLAVPKTYDELEKACRTLKTQGKMQYPLVALYGKQSNLSYEFHNVDSSLGGHWFSDDGRPLFNDATGVAALNRIERLYHGCVHPGVTDYSVEDAVVGLQQGQFAMGLLWMNEAPQMDDASVSKFAGQFGFAPAPSACEGCPAAAYWALDSWVLPANSAVDRELLFRVVMEGMDVKAQQAASSLTLVARAPLANAAQNPYWKPGIETIMAGASAMPRLPYTYLASNAIDRHGIEALLGNTSVQMALDDAARDYTDGVKSGGVAR